MMPVRKSQNWLPGIFNDFFGNEWLEKANSTSPAINIIESEKDYKVEIAAPGLTKDDFSIRIRSPFLWRKKRNIKMKIKTAGIYAGNFLIHNSVRI